MGGRQALEGANGHPCILRSDYTPDEGHPYMTGNRLRGPEKNLNKKDPSGSRSRQGPGSVPGPS